jgi:hypothetical protein
MSFIHYKLITNKNFEKVTFDGVSLSVFELKKIVFEKKFRKPYPVALAHNGGGALGSKKPQDVDLEVTNVDTNEGKFCTIFKIIINHMKFSKQNKKLQQLFLFK